MFNNNVWLVNQFWGHLKRVIEFSRTPTIHASILTIHSCWSHFHASVSRNAVEFMLITVPCVGKRFLRPMAQLDGRMVIYPVFCQRRELDRKSTRLNSSH